MLGWLALLIVYGKCLDTPLKYEDIVLTLSLEIGGQVLDTVP